MMRRALRKRRVFDFVPSYLKRESMTLEVTESMCSVWWSLIAIQPGPVKLALWHHWMHLSYMHPVTSANQFHSPRLYYVHVHRVRSQHVKGIEAGTVDSNHSCSEKDSNIWCNVSPHLPNVFLILFTTANNCTKFNTVQLQIFISD